REVPGEPGDEPPLAREAVGGLGVPAALGVAPADELVAQPVDGLAAPDAPEVEPVVEFHFAVSPAVELPDGPGAPGAPAVPLAYGPLKEAVSPAAPLAYGLRV